MTEIMEGITILNQTGITETPVWIMIMLIISMIVFLIGIVVVIFTSDKVSDICEITVNIALAMMFFSLLLLVFIKTPTGEYTYDCLINEDVSMTEFYEKYEVVEINGQIWTIKEK